MTNSTSPIPEPIPGSSDPVTGSGKDATARDLVQENGTPEFGMPAGPEYTLRAVLTGMGLAAILSACNVYVGLKLGNALGMSLIAALLGYGFWRGFRAVAGGESFGILENNISQTASSAGASVASAGLAAPIPALALLTGQVLPWHLLTLWLLSVMLVGIVIAIPVRRQMIVNEKLPFASGQACATLLHELHAKGKDALSRVVAFFGTAAGAGLFKLFRDHAGWTAWPLPITVGGLSARTLNLAFNPSALLFGVGGLIGIRIGTSLLIGATIAYLFAAPLLVDSGIIPIPASVPIQALTPDDEARLMRLGITHDAAAGTLTSQHRLRTGETLGVAETVSDPKTVYAGPATLLWRIIYETQFRAALDSLEQTSRATQPSYRTLNSWLLWPGMTFMVVASLTAFVLSWPSIKGTFRSTRRTGNSAAAAVQDVFSGRAFIAAAVVVLSIVVVAQVKLFGIVWWAAVLSVLLSAFLAIVAARVSGETGVGMTGPIGKITQIVFGTLIPKNPVPNLMAANVAGGAAIQCGDLLEDLKCGYLIGASPKKQVWGQLWGTVVGAAVGSAVYGLLIPDAAALQNSELWPAPSARTWKAVAELFAGGFEGLPAGAPLAMCVAAATAILLTVLERHGPRSWRPYILSPISLGFAFILPAQYSLSLFLGGLIAWILSRVARGWTARFLVAICAGLIAGESLTDIGQAVWKVLF